MACLWRKIHELGFFAREKRKFWNPKRDPVFGWGKTKIFSFTAVKPAFGKDTIRGKRELSAGRNTV
jgi:hypothetical protein